MSYTTGSGQVAANWPSRDVGVRGIDTDLVDNVNSRYDFGDIHAAISHDCDIRRLAFEDSEKSRTSEVRSLR